MNATTFHQSQHLTEADLQPPIRGCPICGHDGPRAPVFCVQNSPLVEMLECTRCRGCSASRMPLSSVLDRYYAAYYASGEEKVTFSSRAYFARHLLHYLHWNAACSLKILDFGGGDGSLAREVARQLIAAKCASAVAIDLVDYEPPGVSQDSDITLNAFRSLEEVNGPYDLVLASAILEHIPDLHPVLTKLFQLVGEGGWFYARTPWVLPLASVVRNFDITFPAHVHDLGNAFWSRVPEVFGLLPRYYRSAVSPVETSFRGTLCARWRRIFSNSLRDSSTRFHRCRERIVFGNSSVAGRLSASFEA